MWYYINPINWIHESELVKTAVKSMLFLIIANLSCYVVPSLFYPREFLFDMIRNALDFLYFSPAYMHTLLIYAFCNVNDLSWGTKGL